MTGEVVDQSSRWRMLLVVFRAQRVTVVADSQRIGDVALARICTIDQVDGLVTDDVADPDQVRRLRDAGVDVTLV